MEDELKTKLLDRLDRKVIPTVLGQILYRHAKDILSRIDDLKKELNESTGKKITGKLIIGTGVTIGENIMPHLLSSFKKSYPEVELSLRILDTNEIKNQVLSYELEMGIVGAQINHKDLFTKRFTEDRLVLIVHPSHSWAERKNITLSELSKEPMFVREEGSGTRMSILSELKKRGMEEHSFNIVMELGSSGAIKQAVMLKQGVAIVNRQAVSGEINRGLLVEVPMSDFELKKEFYIVFHRRKTKSPPLEAFLKFLKGY
ncbi:MAG: LysR substrate-binding domain-containing protein [bacterium]